MSTSILWFRSDLRLHDNRVLERAILWASRREDSRLLCVYLHDPVLQQPVRWGFPRMGAHRRRFLDATLHDLAEALAARGQRLQVLSGSPRLLLAELAAQVGAERIFCEDIPAPEEEAEVAALRARGLEVEAIWQSSLLDPQDLPFAIEELPAVFTDFRRRAEAAKVVPRTPLPVPKTLPPPPVIDDPRYSVPERSAGVAGGETAALRHLQAYFASDAPQRYKETRNGLYGDDYSTRLSPWLATGALSPRQAFAALRDHEAQRGANESTYWIWFELLWRDYFRFLHRQHGVRLYRASGLTRRAPPEHDPQAFLSWCEGRTGQEFIDAGMRELASTGHLSNRLRQNVASWLIHDLRCDFRAGAAWFESQLIDYDPCSNQGNWLYLAGRGTDPRGGRRFDPVQQAQHYDASGTYRGLWKARD